MKETQPILSLCIPTNGISEWVFPVLDSIYNQKVDNNLFEVIVSDNGNNKDFELEMEKFCKIHTNILYKKNNSFMFDNQLEALKIAKGSYLKFLNHRALLTNGSLEHLIKIIKNNIDEKPVIFFSCGNLKNDFYELSNFNSFVRELRRFASWTNGVGIWKNDYDHIPFNKEYDKISPHSYLLFSERNKSKYIIDNFIFSEEIEHDHKKKGTYDLFKAFAVEEIAITLRLFIDGSISSKTFKFVKNDYKKFVSQLYYNFCIRKKDCSYMIDGFNESMGIFLNKFEVIFNAYCIFFIKIIKKLLRRK